MRMLSPNMVVAINVASARGGRLIRVSGGYWTYPDCPVRDHTGAPYWYTDAGTIHALVEEEMFDFIDWREAADGKRTPIAAMKRAY